MTLKKKILFSLIIEKTNENESLPHFCMWILYVYHTKNNIYHFDTNVRSITTVLHIMHRTVYSIHRNALHRILQHKFLILLFRFNKNGLSCINISWIFHIEYYLNCIATALQIPVTITNNRNIWSLCNIWSDLRCSLMPWDKLTTFCLVWQNFTNYFSHFTYKYGFAYFYSNNPDINIKKKIQHIKAKEACRAKFEFKKLSL